MYTVERMRRKEEGIFPKTGCRHKGRQHGLSWCQEAKEQERQHWQKLPARGTNNKK